MSQNIVLTGKSGLIGSTVYRQLLKAGNRVWSLGRREDDFFLDLGYSTPPTLDFHIDVFVHCAGITDEEIKKNEYRAINRGTGLLVDLVNWAKKMEISQFIYISTAHVYGDLNRAINEKSITIPKSIYGILHLFAEQYIRMQFPNYLILRPCAVYGPIEESFSRWELIPFSFPRELALNSQITIQSHGKQWRNFVSTAIIAQIIKNNLAECGGKVINPLGNYSMSIRDFADFCVGILQPFSSTSLGWSVGGDEIFDNKFSYLSEHGQVIEDGKELIDHIFTTFQKAGRQYGPN
jgi:UDP-glucose 4-epimerase